FFFFLTSRPHRIFHSFPTRRSSDLAAARSTRSSSPRWRTSSRTSSRGSTSRSEEHTSDLQSRQYLVCRLLLEKKKKKKIRYNIYKKKKIKKKKHYIIKI